MDEELPPEPQLIESMRAVGYSIETALADIVDNSIAARARNVQIDFVGLPKPVITILDDGDGMTRDELRTAMKLAGRSPTQDRESGDLGRFGLGLKTASFSQAKKLTVVSLRQNGELHAAVWDLDRIEKESRWLLTWLDVEAVQLPQTKHLLEQGHGTLVVWEELDQVTSSSITFDSELRSQAARAEDHLGLVFHRFIDGQGVSKVSIFLNGNKLESIDPFFTKLQATQQRPTTSVELKNGTVTVTPFILPHISKLSKADAKVLESTKKRLKDSQGFYVYRAKRLISFGTWFRISPKTELAKMARVRVDTPNSLDKDWKLGIMKSSVEPPAELRKVLSNLVPNIVGDSRKVVLRKGSKVISNATAAWQFREIGSRLFALEINREHPLLASLSGSLTREQLPTLELLINQLEIGLPTADLVNRLSLDQAVDVKESTTEELKNIAAGLMKVLSGGFATRDQALAAIYKLEPFASDPFAKEQLDSWSVQLIKEEKND